MPQIPTAQADITALQTQNAALLDALRQVLIYIGDYPPQDDWHAAKAQAVAKVRALVGGQP